MKYETELATYDNGVLTIYTNRTVTASISHKIAELARVGLVADVTIVNMMNGQDLYQLTPAEFYKKLDTAKTTRVYVRIDLKQENQNRIQSLLKRA